MPREHFVVQGEGISKIALKYGFFWETVWNHGANAALRELRQDPELLLPGDVVEIPDRREKNETCGTDSRYRFRLKGVPARLVIRLLDEDGDPRAEEDYILIVDGDKRVGKTDKNGVLREWVPPDAEGGRLILRNGRETFDISFGTIDPLDTVSGVQSVLKNLGYRDLAVTGSLDDATREALSGFQRSHGLTATGEPDQTTAAALRSVYMAAG